MTETIKKTVKRGWKGTQGYVYLPALWYDKCIDVIDPLTGDVIKTGELIQQRSSGKMFVHHSWIGKELIFSVA
jgi:hypothetical protein